MKNKFTPEKERLHKCANATRYRNKRLANMTPDELKKFKKNEVLRTARWQKRNPNKVKAWRNPTELYSMIYYLIKQAVYRNPHLCKDVLVDDWVNIYYSQDGKCAMSGKKMTMGTANCRFKISPDQIVPGLGYTKENIQFLTIQANRQKFTYSMKDTISFCKDVAAHNK